MTLEYTTGSPIRDTAAPAGPIEERWDERRFAAKLVNPANRRKHTVIVVGTGLAGGSAGATLAEQGYGEAQVTPWFGIVVPKGTPQPIVEKIDRALEASLALPDTRDKLDKAGCEARSAPLGAFADLIKADVALWAKVVKEAGITAD